MKKVVITGATGSVGIGLIEELIKQDICILALCHKESKRVNNIPKHPLIRIKYCNLDELCTVQINSNYDVFFHLAWQGTTGEGRIEHRQQIKNIQYTCDAVELAEKLGCHTFVGVGSQAEFGRKNEKLSGNTYGKPENAYGIAKLCAGMLTRTMCEEKKIKHIWIRLLSVYGPYDNENSFIISTVKNMIQNKDIFCTQGKQIWDYLYYKDAAKAIILLSQKGKSYKSYCVGSGEEVTIKDYIKQIRIYTNSSSKIVWGAIPYSKNQVMYLCADINELKQDTGFCQEFTFERGIKEIICFLEKYRMEEIKVCKQ